MKKVLSFALALIMTLGVSAAPIVTGQTRKVQPIAPKAMTTAKPSKMHAPRKAAQQEITITHVGGIAACAGKVENTAYYEYQLFLEDAQEQKVAILSIYSLKMDQLAGWYAIAPTNGSYLVINGQNKPVYGVISIQCTVAQSASALGTYTIEGDLFDTNGNSYVLTGNGGFFAIDYAKYTKDPSTAGIALTDAAGQIPGQLVAVYTGETEQINEDYWDNGYWGYEGYDNDHYVLCYMESYEQDGEYYIDNGAYYVEAGDVSQVDWEKQTTVNPSSIMRGVMEVEFTSESEANFSAFLQCEDGNVYYVYDTDEDPVTPPVTDENYQFDENSAFSATFNNIAISPVEGYPNEFYLDADGDSDKTKAISLYFITNGKDQQTTIPAGTYTISDTYEAGTVLASAGYDGQIIYPSYAYTSKDGQNIQNIWFIVSGTVTVKNVNGKLQITLTGKNSLGQNINVTISDSSTPTPTQTYTITVQANNASMGSVSGSGTYMAGDVVTLQATPYSGYRFTQWSDGNKESTRNITVTKSETYIAYFEAGTPQPTTCSITVIASSNGTVRINNDEADTWVYDSFNAGTTVTITAIPNQGYLFDGWDDGNMQNPRQVTLTQSCSFSAKFKAGSTPQPANYTITVQTSNSAQGTVSGGGSFAYGATTTIYATANAGYRFTSWSDGNQQNPRTITVTGNATYTAYFAQEATPQPATYTITVQTSNSAQGTVSGSGTYAYGAQATIYATANAGYRFTSWSDGNQQNPRTITVTGNATYTAYFTAEQPTTFTITAQASDSKGGYVIGGGTYQQGSTITLNAYPNQGYYFAGWTDGSQDNPRQVVVNGNATYYAIFLAQQASGYNITVGSNDATMGYAQLNFGQAIYTVSTSTFDNGTQIWISATANPNHEFVQWSDGNTQNPRQVYVTQNASYIAQFRYIYDAIDEIMEDEATSTKYIQNGVLYILRDGKTYNAQGQEIR